MIRIMHQDQVEFIPGMQDWFSVQNLINVIHNINTIKNKNYMIDLHELSHYIFLIAEGRILIDEFCLDGKLLHIVCDRFPGPSIPGGQWDYHL